MKRFPTILLALLGGIVGVQVVGLVLLVATGRLTGEKLDLIAKVMAGTLAYHDPAESGDGLGGAVAAATRKTEPGARREASDGEAGRRDIEMLRRTLAELKAGAQAALENAQRQRQELQREKAEWLAKKKQETDTRKKEGLENLKRILDAMKPRDAKRYLMEWPEDEVVELLRDMDDRKVSRIFSECKTPEEQQKAAELMMRLRKGA